MRTRGALHSGQVLRRRVTAFKPSSVVGIFPCAHRGRQADRSVRPPGRAGVPPGAGPPPQQLQAAQAVLPLPVRHQE